MLGNVQRLYDEEQSNLGELAEVGPHWEGEKEHHSRSAYCYFIATLFVQLLETLK